MGKRELVTDRSDLHLTLLLCSHLLRNEAGEFGSRYAGYRRSSSPYGEKLLETCLVVALSMTVKLLNSSLLFWMHDRSVTSRLNKINRHWSLGLRLISTELWTQYFFRGRVMVCSVSIWWIVLRLLY